MKNNICNNCNKSGHLFHNCKLPITSYGIILFTHINKELKYLMICRKDTFGYIDFIRGKYSPYNFEQIQNIVNEMSNSEKTRILNNNFQLFLWLFLGCRFLLQILVMRNRCLFQGNFVYLLETPTRFRSNSLCYFL